MFRCLRLFLTGFQQNKIEDNEICGVNISVSVLVKKNKKWPPPPLMHQIDQNLLSETTKLTIGTRFLVKKLFGQKKKIVYAIVEFTKITPFELQQLTSEKHVWVITFLNKFSDGENGVTKTIAYLSSSSTNQFD